MWKAGCEAGAVLWPAPGGPVQGDRMMTPGAIGKGAAIKNKGPTRSLLALFGV